MIEVKKEIRIEVRLLYTLTFILLGLGAYSIHNTNLKDYHRCQSVEKIKSYNYDAINRAIKVLPTIAYYKNPDHKNELSAQLVELKRVKVQFSPSKCHKSTV